MANMMRGPTGPFSYAQGVTPPPAPPAAPPPPSGAPQYGDIFQYLDPNTEGAKATWAKGTPNQTIVGYQTDKDGNQVAQYGMDYNNYNTIPDKYKGMVAGIQNVQGNGNVANFDFSKLPNQGKLANGMTIDQMYSLGTGKDPTMYMKFQGGRKQDDMYVKDPSKMIWDPNFGWLNPKMNFGHPPEDKSWLDYVGMAAQAGAGMAMPVFGLGMGLAQAGGRAADGDWKGALRQAAPSLIGAGIGASGLQLPPGISDALQYARLANSGLNLYRGIHG